KDLRAFFRRPSTSRRVETVDHPSREVVPVGDDVTELSQGGRKPVDSGWPDHDWLAPGEGLEGLYLEPRPGDGWIHHHPCPTVEAVELVHLPQQLHALYPPFQRIPHLPGDPQPGPGNLPADQRPPQREEIARALDVERVTGADEEHDRLRGSIADRLREIEI